MEQFFASLKQVWSALAGPELTTDLGVNSKGLCALPMPKTMAKAPKVKVQDAYVLNHDTNTWGFNQTTADRHNDGSVDALTAYDIDALKQRNQWPSNSSNRKVRAKMKSLWHSGATDKEIATACGCSESLSEKITAAFSAALSQQLGEGV